jgi:hypothetical protein
MKYFTQAFDALRVVNFFPQGNRNKLKHKTKLKSKELDQGGVLFNIYFIQKNFLKKGCNENF